MKRTVAIIGGGAAGMSAASRVKKLRPEWDVKVFEATEWVSHAPPCGIPPYVVEGLSPPGRSSCTTLRRSSSRSAG